MRKSILHIILGIFVTFFCALRDVYPLGELYLKNYTCTFDLHKTIDQFKENTTIPYIDAIKEDDVSVLIDMRRDFCNQKY